MVTTLAISGMSCGSCVQHVEHAVRAMRNVQAVRVDLRAGTAVITHEAAVAPAELIKAISAVGYSAILTH